MFSKIFAVSLITTSTLLVLPNQVQTRAANNISYIVVSAKNGLNVRDKNCNVIGTYGYGSLLDYRYDKYDDNVIICEISGKSLRMASIKDVFLGGGGDKDKGFVAQDYIKITKSNTNITGDEANLAVNATGGLNIRDENCKQIGVVANNTILKVPTGVGGSVMICERDGEFYEMTYVEYNGQVRYAAEYYLKNPLKIPVPRF